MLIAGVDDDGAHVYSIDSAGGSIPDSYCATGSGSPYMYGVLEDKFKEGMTRNEAVEVVARALLASAQRDVASGNGMDLCVITPKDGFQLVSDDELEALFKSFEFNHIPRRPRVTSVMCGCFWGLGERKMRMTLAEIKNKAKEIIPDGIPYTVDLEAGTISIITPTPDAFAEQSNSLTVKLAKAVRRRIVIDQTINSFH